MPPPDPPVDPVPAEPREPVEVRRIFSSRKKAEEYGRGQLISFIVDELTAGDGGVWYLVEEAVGQQGQEVVYTVTAKRVLFLKLEPNSKEYIQVQGA